MRSISPTSTDSVHTTKIDTGNFESKVDNVNSTPVNEIHIPKTNTNNLKKRSCCK